MKEIKEQMQRLGISQQELGAAIGRSQAWVHGYLLADPVKTLRRLYVQHPDDFEALLRTLQLDRRAVLRAIGITGTLAGDEAEPRVMVQGIPVYPEGATTDEVEEAQETGHAEHLYIPLRTTGRHGAVRCDGDGAAPYVVAGDYVVVALDLPAAPGDMVAVMMNGDGLRVRRLVQRDPLLLGTLWQQDRKPEYVAPAAVAHVYGPIVARVSYR